MPELPEVETTLRGIAPHITSQIIKKVVIRESRLRWPIPHDIQHILIDQKIISVVRRAKYLLLNTDKGSIIIHLGMSGHLRILLEYAPPNKHDHVDIEFSHNKILRFTDPRRFGAFLWVPGNPYQHPLLKNLGVEPLTKMFTGDYLWQKAQGKTVPVKSFLMNNHIVTGIGNIYATEALFASRIYPAQPAQTISIEQFQELAMVIKKILRDAIRRGGTTLKDFVNSEGKPGYFSNQLQAYGRAGQPCMICQSVLKSMQIAQRSTVYCERCQHHYLLNDTASINPVA